MKKLILPIYLILLLLTGCQRYEGKVGATSDISAAAIATKYQAANEIKAKYTLSGTVLERVA